MMMSNAVRSDWRWPIIFKPAQIIYDRSYIINYEEDRLKVELKKDMYADLEKIEKRGKKKKRGLFGRKADDIKDVTVNNIEEKETAEAFADMSPTEPARPPEPEPEPQPEIAPRPVHKPDWRPLSGRRRKNAEHNLLEYKRKLDTAYKAKKMSRDQCIEKVRLKEVELGLRPPE